jgi:hypothetical protein
VTVVSLEVPFVETSASGLRWVLDDRPRAALAVRQVDLGSTLVEARVLGASHQVLVRDGAACVGEVVACGEGGHSLPGERVELLASHRYELRSSVWHGVPATVRRAAARLVARIADQPSSVVASYPGDPHAITAIVIADLGDRLCWRTWHAYPRTGELVVTRSTLARR